MSDFDTIRDAKTLAAAIREAFPESDDALADTIDGETDLTNALYRVLMSAEQDREFAGGAKLREAELKERRERLEAREEKKRSIVRDAMEACGVKKIDRPELSAWLMASQPSVVIIDEHSIPEDYLVTTVRPDKVTIKKALKDGYAVPGCQLSNGGSHLTVRRT